MRVDNNPIPPGGMSNANQAQFAANYSILSQLAGAAPTSGVAAPPPNMSQQQINTYWMMRAYSDLMTIYSINSNPNTPNGAALIADMLKDLNYIQGQCTTLDPNVMGEISATIADKGTLPSSGTGSGTDIIANMMATLTGGNSQTYNLSNMTPDATYYMYTIAFSLALTPMAKILGDSTFWANNVLSNKCGEFMATYMYERSLNPNGTVNTTELNNFESNFNTQFAALFTFVKANQSTFPNLYNALFAPGTGVQAAMQNMASTGGQPWPFSDSQAPTSADNCPPAWWDNTGSTPPAYTWSYQNQSLLNFVDQSLSQFLGF
jgi:hypothetical protein